MVDVLRGGSALAVALFHFNEPFGILPDAYHRLLKYGWLGVSVFFVISGFCIAAARDRDRVIPFWRRRLLRIYPVYWASLLLVAAVVAVRYATGGINDVTLLPKTGWELLCTVAAVVKPASVVTPMNWAYWSLS